MRKPEPQSVHLAVAIALACPLLSAGTALAQDRVALSGHAGITIPPGALSKMEGVGASVGGGIAVRVHRDVALRLGQDAAMLEGRRLRSGEGAPGANLHHLIALQGPGGVSARLRLMKGGFPGWAKGALIGAGLGAVVAVIDWKRVPDDAIVVPILPAVVGAVAGALVGEIFSGGVEGDPAR